jgi:hypothetical protein
MRLAYEVIKNRIARLRSWQWKLQSMVSGCCLLEYERRDHLTERVKSCRLAEEPRRNDLCIATRLRRLNSLPQILETRSASGALEAALFVPVPRDGRRMVQGYAPCAEARRGRERLATVESALAPN